jgi:hypothetical protein
MRSVALDLGVRKIAYCEVNEAGALKRATVGSQWFQQVAKRRGNRIAIIALARRLAGVLWAMWRDGTVYDPALVGQRSATGIHREAQSAETRAKAIEAAAHRASRRPRFSSTTKEVAST